jgi:hypothetical protein
MQDAFVWVLVVVLAGAVIAAAWAGIASRAPYDQIGQGGLLEDAAPKAGGVATVVAAAERDAEIRQMLDARNARRIARGQDPLDVEAELARLLEAPRPAADPALVDEVRQLVAARNARRARAGKPPLDVEEEVARQLRELT